MAEIVRFRMESAYLNTTMITGDMLISEKPSHTYSLGYGRTTTDGRSSPDNSGVRGSMSRRYRHPEPCRCASEATPVRRTDSLGRET